MDNRSAEEVDQVLSRLKADVSVKDGLASLTNGSFRVPGATAAAGGMFNRLNKYVVLRGTVSIVADASAAITSKAPRSRSVSSASTPGRSIESASRGNQRLSGASKDLWI
jgi:hypothetical protein